jgi:hypothetical protein
MAIYGLQRQVHQLAACLPAPGGYGGLGPFAAARTVCAPSHLWAARLRRLALRAVHRSH